MGEKNAAASRLWNSLSDEEKRQYNDKAAAINSKEAAVDIRKEVKKLHDTLNELVSIIMLFIFIPHQ